MVLAQLAIKPLRFLFAGHPNRQRRTAGLALRWI